MTSFCDPAVASIAGKSHTPTTPSQVLSQDSSWLANTQGGTDVSDCGTHSKLAAPFPQLPVRYCDPEHVHEGCDEHAAHCWFAVPEALVSYCDEEHASRDSQL